MKTINLKLNLSQTELFIELLCSSLAESSGECTSLLYQSKKTTRYGPWLQSTSYTQLVNAVTEDRSSGQCLFLCILFTSESPGLKTNFTVSWHPCATSSGKNPSRVRQEPYNCCHPVCFQPRWGRAFPHPV